ncbi:type II secretion system F family protein [Shewanella baltica]|uniref:type II secretion system F family protein n=1 Tax=Shewanella baltica TaxID=62322 RepID=UPI00217D9D4E|nr:type II secretion system F family protein [Shewanella baltica]MCS6238074.1 type II secretion system F family protein [Shewanella baltica]
MALFIYKAYDASGALINGELDALSIKHAKELLQKDKLNPVSLVEQSLLVNKKGFNLFQSDTVTLDDVEFVTAELSLLLQSGVKIDRALAVLARTKAGSSLATLLQTLSNDVRKGQSLSEAMAKHPKIFDSLYINLVTIGESSGNLVAVFAGLAQDLKYRKQLKNKITQAIAYPTVILFVCICSVLFIFNFVVPKLTVMFADAVELPIYTQILLGVSDFIQNYQFHLFFVFLLLVFGFRWMLQQGHFAHKFDNVVLSIPLLNNTVNLIERIRFTSSMSLMLNSDVKLDQALVLSSGSVKNQVIARNLTGMKDKVRKGESITTALKQSGLFPVLFLSLLEVGEESGKMAPIFEEIAERSRTEFSQWTDKMTSLIEPLMILFMGGIVGSVVVIMMMSIVSINDIGI